MISFLFSLFFFGGLHNADVTDSHKEVVLQSYQMSQCDHNANVYKMISRVSNMKWKKDTCFLEIALVQNCCLEIKPETEFRRDTLYIYNRAKRMGLCDCNCCFSLDLVLTGLRSDKFEVVFQNEHIPKTNYPYRTYPIKYELKNGDTVNMVNIYGEREGLWLFYFDSTNRIKIEKFYDGSQSIDGRENLDWSKTYDHEGRLVAEEKNDTIYKYFESGSLSEKYVFAGIHAFYQAYYENGQVKRSCQTYLDTVYSHYFLRDSCSYWNKEGLLIETKKEDHWSWIRE